MKTFWSLLWSFIGNEVAFKTLWQIRILTDYNNSSGSTAFPKPIYLSNRYLFNVMSCFEVLVNSQDHLESMTEKDVALPSVPL